MVERRWKTRQGCRDLRNDMAARSLDFLFASYVLDCLLKKLATQKWQPVRTDTQEKQLSLAKRAGKGWSSKIQKQSLYYSQTPQTQLHEPRLRGERTQTSILARLKYSILTLPIPPTQHYRRQNFHPCQMVISPGSQDISPDHVGNLNIHYHLILVRTPLPFPAKAVPEKAQWRVFPIIKW